MTSISFNYVNFVEFVISLSHTHTSSIFFLLNEKQIVVLFVGGISHFPTNLDGTTLLYYIYFKTISMSGNWQWPPLLVIGI